MERRDFLSQVAAGAGVSASLGMGAMMSGCGAAMQTRPELGARDTVDLLGRLERGLGAVRNLPAGNLHAALPSWQLRPDLSERILRTGIEALVVADVARSIPAGVRLPSELAQRLEAELPTLARATGAYHALLAGTPPAMRRNVDRRFRTDPDTAMEITSFIDQHASMIGISTESRLRLRSNTAQITSRIRRQSANAVVDDTISKVETIVARSGGDIALARSSTSHAMIQAIWQQVEGVYTPGGTTQQPAQQLGPQGIYVPPQGELPPDATIPPEEYDPNPGNRELEIGGILIGSGLAAFGLATLIGFAAGSAMWGAIIGATPGSILLIVGIVFLIIGGVQNASAG